MGKRNMILAAALAAAAVSARAETSPGGGFAAENCWHRTAASGGIDNYTRFAPYAVTGGLKLAGYEGRSDWHRLVTGAALSNAMMLTAASAMKHTVREMRPDGTERTSFPSGHAAVAFTAATMLHKEYGETRSPWFSLGGYALASATGMMRVANNRHWAQDVMAGAGIGILATELGYLLADRIWRKHAPERSVGPSLTDMERPSFLDISMGVALHGGSIAFKGSGGEPSPARLSMKPGIVCGMEGAYFLNRYIGVGGMARLMVTPVRALDLGGSDMEGIMRLNSRLSAYEYAAAGGGMKRGLPTISAVCPDGNALLDVSLDMGVYADLPVGGGFSVGMKALGGTRLTGSMAYTASNATQHSEGEEYDIVKVAGDASLNLVGGVSVAWRYSERFAWKAFADIDIARKRYSYTGRAFSDAALSEIQASGFASEHPDIWEAASAEVRATSVGHMSHIVLGGSLSVTF